MYEPAVIEGWKKLRFHFFPESQIRRLRDMSGDLSISLVRPSLVEIPGGVTTQGAADGKTISGVYDRNSCLVASSFRIRGKDGRVDGDAEPDDLSKAVRDERDAYYLGRGSSHYGHFILETLSRAWAWNEFGRDRVPVLQSSVPQFARAFLALIPELAERIEIISAPRRFRNILVPGASFVIAREAHVEFKRMCERMAGHAMIRSEPVTDQPLYLSRAGLSLSRRTLEGETWLERSLEREGFLIVRPETLPVAEQIALVNRHRWIISPQGSACHTRLFSRICTNFVTVTSDYLNPNYMLCDLLCEGTSHYLNALAQPQIGTRVRLARFWEPRLLDRVRLLGALRQLGLVRNSAVFDDPAPDLNGYKLRWIEAARAQMKTRPDDKKKLLEAIDEVTASLDATE
jgi:hypothetical protein